MHSNQTMNISDYVHSAKAVSSAAAALYLGVSRSRVDVLIKTGRLTKVKVTNGQRALKLIATDSLRKYKEERDGTPECRELLTKKLTELAKKKRTVAYQEVMTLCGLRTGNPRDRAKIGALLGAVSGKSFRDKGVLLSVVVVTKGGKQMPNESFFALAEQLGAKSPEMGKEEFFKEHTRKLFKMFGQPKAG